MRTHSREIGNNRKTIAVVLVLGSAGALFAYRADMTATAGVALYCIAERLAFALRAEEEIENR